MSEELVPVTDPVADMVNEGAPDDGAVKLTYEELSAELAKTRKEAADRRVKARDAETKLREYDTWKASQMTELEKAQAEAKQVREDRRNDLVELALTRYGLEAEDADFLRGDTKEEILASAERVAKRLGKTPQEGAVVVTNPNLFPGTRGKPVGSNSSDNPNDTLRNALWGKNS